MIQRVLIADDDPLSRDFLAEFLHVAREEEEQDMLTITQVHNERTPANSQHTVIAT